VATSVPEVDAFPARRLLVSSSIPLTASAARPAHPCWLPPLGGSTGEGSSPRPCDRGPTSADPAGQDFYARNQLARAVPTPSPSFGPP